VIHSFLAVLSLLAPAVEEPKPLPPIECSAVIAAPRPEVWKAFSTTEGVKSWMVAQADIQMKNGGLWKTKYGKEGTLGDERTIVNEVLAFDPERMFVLRIHTPPKGFPFMSSYKDMWTVVYFEEIDGGKTKVTCRGHGFTDSEESKKLRAFFDAGNKLTLSALEKRFGK
jgi:uncharacterized protein YndB with AHSA1/START domain